MKQYNISFWEIWLVISILLIVVMTYTGIMKNSVEVFPNWLSFAILSTINCIICIGVGIAKKEK